MRLSQAPTVPLFIPIAIALGEGAVAEDYAADLFSGKYLTVAEGADTQTFTLRAISDADAHDETLTLTFGTSTDYPTLKMV